MNFEFPELTIPTELEMVKTSNMWWSNHEGISFTDWNETLNANTIPWNLIKLERHTVDEILKVSDGTADMEALKYYFDNILSERVSEYKDGFFIKLISRSPKDFLYDENNHGKPSPLFTPKEALEAIANSMRCFEDMIHLRHIDNCYLVVRPYVKFHPSREWRVMVYGKQIVGISQYYYETKFYRSVDEWFLNNIENEIRTFMNDIVIPNMSVNHFVADVISSDVMDKITLLETNPFGLSDPCLFQDYESLDGSFKIK